MENRRYDSSMQGLLRFAVEHSKSEDAPSESTYTEMDEERKQFLEEALASMTVDIKEEFGKAINILTDDSATSNHKLEALNIIRDLVDNLDFANNFAKMNGTQILMKHLEHEKNEVRVATLNIIAEMSQNNPFCQKQFSEAKILPSLLCAIDNPNKEIASSSIHVISSLIRNFDIGLVEFIKLSGIERLVACLKTNHQKVFIKSCFLIATLSAQNSYVREKFVRCRAIDALAQSIDPVSEYDVKMDSVLFAFAELSKSASCVVSNELRIAIEEPLKEMIARCKDLPECEEMVLNANSTISNLRKLYAK